MLADVKRVEHDRRRGRIHLAIGRRQHALRQLAQGLGDCGLDVLRRRVDVATQGELQRDGG